MSSRYNPDHLISLRNSAAPPSPTKTTSAVALNLWIPLAQKNRQGKSQPFPFNAGEGEGIVTSRFLDKFRSMQTSLDGMHAFSRMAPTDENARPINGIKGSKQVDGAMTSAQPPAVRRKGPGPHRLLGLPTNGVSTSMSPVHDEMADQNGAVTAAPDTDGGMDGKGVAVEEETISPLNPADGAGGDGADTSSPKSEEMETAVDGPPSIVSDMNGVPLPQEASAPVKRTRSFGPHRKLLATTIPILVQSDNKSFTPDEEPSDSLDHDLDSVHVHVEAPPYADADESENDVESPALSDKSVIHDTSPKAATNDHVPRASLGLMLSSAINTVRAEPLNPKASAWKPDGDDNETVEEDVRMTDPNDSEVLNSCDPMPASWGVPSVAGQFAPGNLFNGPLLAGAHVSVLGFYSLYFATVFGGEVDEGFAQDAKLTRILNDPAFPVLRTWIYGRALFVRRNGNTLRDTDIDLKTLVQLWRFAVRIKAPLFANFVTDTIVARQFSATEFIDAADEIDEILSRLRPKHVFRLVIAHAFVTSGAMVDDDHVHMVHQWPKTLLWSILNWMAMGRNRVVGQNNHPCTYHIHPEGDVGKCPRFAPLSPRFATLSPSM